MLRIKIRHSVLSTAVILIVLLSLSVQVSLSANDSGVTHQEIVILKERIAQMSNRIQMLKDREEVEDLISIYGYYLDKNLWDQVADLFTDDGTIEISQRGVYVGRKRIRESLELYGTQNLPPEHLHNHVQAQPVIHIAVDGKTAWSRHRAISQLGSFGKDGLTHGGVYENEYSKENGIWKIKKDHVYTTFFAVYGKGIIAGARGAAMPSEAIPPDLPPTEIYQAFPGVYLPPFHYKHPVTGKDIIWNSNE